MPTYKILTTKTAVVDEMIKRYKDNKSLAPTYRQFSKLKEVYDKYQETKDVLTLRYLLALCVRIRHGNRMPWVDTRSAVDKLVDSGVISESFNDFEELLARVKSILSGIHFAQGSLMVYDTALTIGCLLDVLPQKSIYLYAGAWDGAVILKDSKVIKHVMDVSTWQVSNLFPNIDSLDIENILCDLKSLFKKLKDKGEVTTDDIDKRLEPKICPPFSQDEAIMKMRY
jgi:hypothetical protein